MEILNNEDRSEIEPKTQNTSNDSTNVINSETKPETINSSTEAVPGYTPPEPAPKIGRSKNKRTVILALVGTLVILGGLIGYFTLIKTSSTTKTELVEQNITDLKVGVTGDPTVPETSPIVNYDDSVNFFRNVYSSLVSFNKEGALIPDLATTWVNPDATTWRFNLRPGVKFSDGRNLTSQDVKYSFDSIKALGDQSQFGEYFSEIININIIDSQTLEIKTDRPAPYLLTKLVYLFIIPNGEKNISFSNTVGTGPFVYNKTETIVGAKLVLNRNNNYWGTVPKVEKISFNIYEDEEAKLKDFQQGKISIIDIQTPGDLATVSKMAKVKLSTATSNGVFYFQPNVDPNAKGDFIQTINGKNPLADKRVRLAMWQALDTNAMVSQEMSGMAIPSNEVVAKGVFGYDESLKRPAYNLADAKTLMKEAGYENGFKVKLSIVNLRQNIGEFAQKSWNNLNIDVTLDVFDVNSSSSTNMEKVLNHNFGITFRGWIEDTRDAQTTLMTMFSPKSAMNYGSYSNPALNQLISQMSNTTDQLARKKLIQQGLKLVNDDAAVIPLYDKAYNVAIANDIKWEARPDMEFYFLDAAQLKSQVVVVKKDSGLSKLKFW